MAPVAPSSAVLLAGVLAFTLVVGLLGLVRIRKDRPSLKSYEMPVGSMGLDSARTLAAAKTDAETVSARDTPAGSHMRARDQDMTEEEASSGGTMLQRLGAMLWQLTGIPLLTGDATPAAAANPPIESIDSAAMGNTAAPTRTLLSTATTPEIDAVRAHKAPAAASPVVWSEEEEQDDEEAMQQARSSDEEDYSDGDSDDDMSSQQTNDETFEQMRAHMVIDGLQFYSAVASVSVATVAHAVDIALFRATTIVMRERRKAHEDASILAIETLYPDIMCLPPGANVRYAGIKSVADATQSVARAMAPATTARHLETGFLKAA